MDCFKDLIPEEDLVTEEASALQSRSPLQDGDGDEEVISTEMTRPLSAAADVETASGGDTSSHVNMSNWFDDLDDDQN